MALSLLADEIYDELRHLVPNRIAEITYGDLVARIPPLPPPNANLDAYDMRLNNALGEIVQACRAKKLPALSAIVVRAGERTPGPGYYPVAHPEAGNDRALQLIAWGKEVQEARKTTYPNSL